jgi:hypothetical protein
MVSKKELNDYEFADITEYYDYILESRQNGQHKQAKELFAVFSDKQREDFFNYVENTYYYDAMDVFDHHNGLLNEITVLEDYFKQ